MSAFRRHQSPSESAASRAEQRLDAFIAGLRFDIDSSPAVRLAARQIFAELRPPGIRALLLKGAGLAALLYGEDEHRTYVDLDLLVAPADLEEVEKVLAGLGYRNTTEPLGIDDVGGVVHAHTWQGVPAESDAVIPVELHRWLAGARAAPAAAWEALWRHHTTLDLDGEPITVLARDGQALHVALHAGQHGPEYRRGLAELRLALERWPIEVWRAAAALAREIDAVDAFATGLRLVTEGAELASTLELPTNPVLDWEVRHLRERPRGAFHVDALWGSATFRERLVLIRKALFPDRRWIAGEYRWAERGMPQLAAGYALHILRAPVWGARAWQYRRRARRAA